MCRDRWQTVENSQKKDRYSESIREKAIDEETGWVDGGKIPR